MNRIFETKLGRQCPNLRFLEEKCKSVNESGCLLYYYNIPKNLSYDEYETILIDKGIDSRLMLWGLFKIIHFDHLHEENGIGSTKIEIINYKSFLCDMYGYKNKREQD